MGGSETTTSGVDLQPCGHSTDGGASFLSPSKAPLSTHCESVSISSCVKDGSLAKWPYFGSSPQGGIFRLITAARIALAHGRVDSKVRNDIGAASPGRWHV